MEAEDNRKRSAYQIKRPASQNFVPDDYDSDVIPRVPHKNKYRMGVMPDQNHQGKILPSIKVPNAIAFCTRRLELLSASISHIAQKISLDCIHNDIVNPYRVSILHYVKRVRNMHDIDNFLPLPSRKGDKFDQENWKVRNKEFSDDEICVATNYVILLHT